MARKPAKQRQKSKRSLPKSINPVELAQIKQQAMELIQAKRYIEAQQLYEQALLANLTDASVYANLAALLQIAGRTEDSIPLLQEALTLRPAYPEALINLGNAQQTSGHSKLAIHSFEKAIILNPNLPEAHTGLGVALNALGDSHRAIHHHRAAIRLNPAYPEAWSNLGYALLKQQDGRQEAIASCREALRLQPEYPEALSNLGVALLADGHIDAGISSQRQAVALRPSMSSMHLTLANGLLEQNCLVEAIECYHTAIRLKPNCPKAYAGLAAALKARGELEEALRVANQGLEIQPDWLPTHWQLIETLGELGRQAEALEASNVMLQHDPDSAMALLAKGVLLQRLYRYDEALKSLDLAIQLNPSLNQAHYARGWIYQLRGNTNESIESFKQALNWRPTFYEAGCSQFFTELFCRGDQGTRIRAEAEQFWAQYPSPIVPPFVPQKTSDHFTNPNKPIRLLLISGDIGTHAVSNFLEPLLRGLDRKKFQLVLALTQRRQDARAQELERLADERVNLTGLGEVEAVELLRNQACAVAIETSAWTKHNALRLLRHRVAPAQCHYVGFCGTTGLETIDYMIGDAVLTPPELQNQFTEKLWPLPRCWSTFSPTFTPPPISPRPADQPFTFGSFNNFAKITDSCVDFWSAALRAVPEAQLLLKDVAADETSVRQRVLDQLCSRGVATERIIFQGQLKNWQEHMALYNRIDIALDTTPMTSATTGFEALTMGVPLLAIQTDWMGGRMSSSTLSAIGREHWISRDPQVFARNAVKLVFEIQSETSPLFKQKLREEFLASPLNDGASLCRALEQAFGEMAQRRLVGTT